MKERKKAVRRRDNARIFKKRFKQELRNYSCREGEEHVQWAMRRGKRRLDTSTACSCWMCRNERRNWGNSPQGKTFQERRSSDSMMDDLKEGY